MKSAKVKFLKVERFWSSKKAKINDFCANPNIKKAFFLVQSDTDLPHHRIIISLLTAGYPYLF